MEHKNETRETWDKVAHLYQEKFMDLELYDESYDCFCQLISKPNSRLLEIGSGPGNITRYLLNKMPESQILGIDFAPSMVKLAKINNPNANFKEMDARKIGEIEGYFEGIIAGFCLPYLSKDETARLMTDVSRLLASQGVFYLSFVDGLPSQSGFKASSTGDRTYFYYHSTEKIKEDLIQNGFEIIRDWNLEFKKFDGSREFHTILIARKTGD